MAKIITELQQSSNERLKSETEGERVAEKKKEMWNRRLKTFSPAGKFCSLFELK
jgi:hypothetical protein